ncbi:MAG: cytochrome c [Cyclobacteriaceae bacterium]
MKKLTILITALICCGAIFSTHQNAKDPEANVADLLAELGENRPDHYLENITPEMIKRGEDIIKIGKTIGPDGKSSKYVSKYYTCTSCHNVSREDLNLNKVDQDERLDYAIANKLPYLQGSTFWGIVNRETWYNDDYVLKYGDLVRKAEHSLKESTHLCATVCAQGRPLADWEMESVLAYYWSLQMKVKDLGFSDSELSSIENSKMTNEAKIALIKSKYLQKSPATFAEEPEDKKKGYAHEGNPELGKAIYELGCQHCHRPNGESDVVFENNDLTYKWLVKHIPDNSDLSIYHIIRKGTYAEYGHKEYMPHYTLEKMSHQQVEHLRAFLENPF